MTGQYYIIRKEINLKNLLLLMMLVVSTASYGQEANMLMSESNPEKGDSKKVMMLMHMPMMEQKFQMTDNPDVDFLYNMIPHHKGAVVSSEEYLKYGQYDAVQGLASNIIAAQNKEIAEFTKLITELKKKATKYDKKAVSKVSKDSQKAMMGMMKVMNGVKISGDIDKDFLMGMMPHHQGAIDASKIILTITSDDKIKEIANRIITDQEKEIADIKAMLETL